MDAILIAGPTASGKSALAMRLAREHGGVIVNADSMQVYEPLTHPDRAAFAAGHGGRRAPALRPCGGETGYSTGAGIATPRPSLRDIRSAGRVPVIVGGTGLYFRALTGGLSQMPAIPEEVRAHWRAAARRSSAPRACTRELAAVDSETARSLETRDGQRIVRALEVFHATGRSIGALRGHAGRAACPIRPARRRSW